MTNRKFIELAKDLVKEYAISHTDVTDNVTLNGEDDVYVVWSCFILGNQKALISTILHDGMYYEVTYNSTKKEIYLDAYKKFDNKCITRIED